MAEHIFLFFSKSAPTPRYTILDSRFPTVIRSRKAGLPSATRARKQELDSDRKFSKSKFLKVFLKTTFFSRFRLPCSLLAKNIFSGFRSPHLPSIHNSGLEVSPGNVISEGRPPLCNTSSEAGALDTGGTSRERLGPKNFRKLLFLVLTINAT